MNFFRLILRRCGPTFVLVIIVIVNVNFHSEIYLLPLILGQFSDGFEGHDLVAIIFLILNFQIESHFFDEMSAQRQEKCEKEILAAALLFVTEFLQVNKHEESAE